MSDAAETLIVLGAGEEQVAIYQEARRRGLATVGVDMRADRPGIHLADEFLRISTTEHTRIAAALAGRRVAGVVSTASDTCLASWQRLSDHFRTPWRYPPAAAAVSMDKAEFHRVARSVRLPTYSWVRSDRLGELLAVARTFRYPVVVKPTDACGGRGVRAVGASGELGAALEHAAGHSPSGRVIVEEFLAGRNLTVNVFMTGGEIALAVITEKQVIPGPSFLIGGHLAPAQLDAATESALLSEASRLCAAFDLTDGPANFDVILADNGTRYFVEVGARMCGNGFPQLARALSGVDCIAALVDLALGNPVRLTNPARQRPALLHVLFSPLDTPGEMIAYEGLAEVAAMAGVDTFQVFASAGDVVKPFTESGNKLGWIVVTAEEPAMLATVLSGALRRLRIIVKPLPSRMVACSGSPMLP